MTTYWPGSNIVKSEGNAFDWRGAPAAISQTASWKLSASASKAAPTKQGQFIVYSRAKQNK